jgi:hypothetical protein
VANHVELKLGSPARNYIEVTGAHGNMLFEPAHTRLAGAWDINKAQHWHLATLASGRLILVGW